MSEDTLYVLIAAFDSETGADEALDELKKARDEKLVGVQAAVAMHKDAAGQIDFKDVGLTPGKGALAGVVLGAVVGVLTGGTGLALGAVGALVGGLAGKKKQDSRLSTDRINQLAASLPPASSAAVIVMEPGWIAVLQENLELLGADVLTVDVPADIAQQPAPDQVAAYEAFLRQLQQA